MCVRACVCACVGVGVCVCVYLIVCDIETLTLRRPRSKLNFCATENETDWDIPKTCPLYRGADKSLARSGRKQARKHTGDSRGFNNIETRTVIRFLFSCRARRRRKFTPF